MPRRRKKGDNKKEERGQEEGSSETRWPRHVENTLGKTP